MASNKKIMYNVEMKHISKKKRRKSDLVIMWQSIWDVTLRILFKVQLSLHEIWETTRLWFWHDEIRDVQTFLKKYLPRVPDDFSNSWRDGKLLCQLLNKLQPGCIPEADNLDQNYGLRNMYRAFDVLDIKFGIVPTAFVEDLVICLDGSDFKLLEILSQLKEECDKKPVVRKVSVQQNEIVDDKQNNCPDTKYCIAKGTGLMVAFVGRSANFIIFCTSMSDLNLVVEIKGPLDTIFRERITKRSPKKKHSTTMLEQNHTHSFSRSNSYSEKIHSRADTNEVEDSAKNLIPVEYEIYMNQISITYTPLIQGQHIISILWHGQHVSDSPYVVSAEPTFGIHSTYIPKQLKATLKSSEDSGTTKRRKATVQFQEPIEEIEPVGRVVKRRVLRHIVKIKGKDIVVDSNDIDHLASALLKMDYDIQTDPLKNRRNSWGFAGDAERKVSMIRQFCVPPHEMEAQHMKLQRRSRSFTINDNIKTPHRRSTSFETEDIIQQTRLETVLEGIVDSCEKRSHQGSEQDDVFAYYDEEFEAGNEVSNKKEAENTKCSTSTCNAANFMDITDESIDQASTMILDDEMIQSLLDNDTKEILFCNDLNVENRETLPPDDLTRASEFSVRQKENEEARELNPCRKTDHDGENNENVDELLSMNFKVKRTLDCTNAKAKQNKLYSDNIIYLNRNEFEGINENVRDRNAQEFENETTTIPSSPEIEKLPSTPKYSDTFSGNSSNTGDKYNYSIQNNVNKMRRLAWFKNTSRFNFHAKKCSQRDLERKKRYRLLNKQQNNREQAYFIKEPTIKSKTISIEAQSYGKMSGSQNDKQTCDVKNIENVRQVESSILHKNDKTNKKAIHYYEQKDSSECTLNFTFCDCDGKKYFPNYGSSQNKKKTEPMQKYNTFLENCVIETDTPQDQNKYQSISLSPELQKNINTLNNCSKSDIYAQPLNSTFNSDYDTFLFETNSSFQAVLSQLDSKESPANNSSNSDHNLVSLEQYNFNQFNPSVEKTRGSLIKRRIKKLEMAVLQDSQKAFSKATSKSFTPTEKLNVKEKLSFWENAYQKKDLPHQVTPGETINGTEEQNELHEEKLMQSNIIQMDLDDIGDTASHHQEDNFTSINKANSSWIKPTDIKLNSDGSKLNMSPKSKRSFSDPVILDSASRERIISEHNIEIALSKPNPTSSTDNLSSSIDADYFESSIDDGVSSADAIISTEDEYIDDEIPDTTLFTYWGDLSPMKSLKTANISECKEYCQYIDTEILKNQYQCVQSSPSECKVFGIGTYYGYVAVKNRFQVLTKGAGNGNLSASLQGFGKHDVCYVSVRYTQKDIYEVTYQVTRPGLYLISLRWMENHIVGSPFLCKITF